MLSIQGSRGKKFRSGRYWSRRYAAGGNSGAGSYGRLAQFKADTVNAFVKAQKVASVIEFGCGDGNQLSLAQYPKYLGLDVAPVCIERCRQLFAKDPSKRFKEVRRYRGERAELALSLDVIYHLAEDKVYHRYMRDLFRSAKRYVVIYSSCQDEISEAKHVRHRVFMSWVDRHAKDWRLVQTVANPYPLRFDPKNETFADFYIYKRVDLQHRVKAYLRAKVREFRIRRAAIVPGQPHNLPGKLVLSLTSYPPRFKSLDLTLRCLLTQDVRPDNLILWVAFEDYKRLPRRVLRLQDEGLIVRQCEDLKSYKKIIPTLKEFPDAFIALADDDMAYPSDWLAHMVNAYRSNKEIFCRRAHRITLDQDGNPLPYRQWESRIKDDEPSRAVFPTAGGGVLYPPGSLPTATLDESAFMRLCPKGDDIWLHWIATRNGCTFRRVGPVFKCPTWSGSQAAGLHLVNAYGGGNDRQIAAMIAEYGKLPTRNEHFSEANFRSRSSFE